VKAYYQQSHHLLIKRSFWGSFKGGVLSDEKSKKSHYTGSGVGARFLSAIKAIPKEMLPIVDKPTIQYFVEEAIDSGIEDIIIVTGKGKRAIEDLFDHAFELEHNLFEKGKFDLLEKAKQSSKLADIHSFMPVMNGDEPNYWLSSITLIGQVRPIDIMETLEKENIESRPVWKPMHLQPFFEKYDFVGTAVSEKLF
jgi:hypothetical protein